MIHVLATDTGTATLFTGIAAVIVAASGALLNLSSNRQKKNQDQRDDASALIDHLQEQSLQDRNRQSECEGALERIRPLYRKALEDLDECEEKLRAEKRKSRELQAKLAMMESRKK